MTWEDNTAGWACVTLWPAYLKAGKNEDGKRPNVVRFAPDIFGKVKDVIKDRQYNINGKPVEKNDLTILSMKMVCDESMESGEWEIGWGHL